MTPTSPDRHPGTPGPAHGPASAGLIWTRPLKEKRERPVREAIVAAATDLSGAHGLDAVSIRRVAAALHTRPMDLYRHFARKDELIDLMADEAAAAPAHHSHRAAGRLQHDEPPAASVGRSSPGRWTRDTTAPLQELMRCSARSATSQTLRLTCPPPRAQMSSPRAHGDRRLVVLAPPSVEDQQDRRGPFYRFVRLAMPVMMRAATRDHKAQPRLVKDSGLDRTIAHGAGVFTDGPHTGRYHAGPITPAVDRRVSDADLAGFMLAAASNGKFLHSLPLVSQ